ncbi:MAG TPA: class I SAM-dependent methyltransferase [Burkholderiales bacterium]|nr:class I SAM-dependent methyltransferase [Burkholderiales bacterium]
MPSRRTFLSLLTAAAAWRALGTRAQERFSPFVGSDPENVRRMVELARPRAGETVIDLGSGDGRIVFAAVKAQPGVRGLGVDINAELVAKSNAAARAQGLADRVRFLHQNAFDADLGKVDVIFMWLFPELMRLLRPKILAEARPGTRVVAATWDMGSWPPDAVDDQGGTAAAIRLWIVPARVKGGWEWQATLGGRTYRFDALFDEQRMQQVEGVVRVGNRREILHNVILRGEFLQFTLAMTLPGTGYSRLAFAGRVRGDAIEGTIEAQIPRPGQPLGEEEETTDSVRVPWLAHRTTVLGYFAPTGTDIS